MTTLADASTSPEVALRMEMVRSALEIPTTDLETIQLLVVPRFIQAPVVPDETAPLLS